MTPAERNTALNGAHRTISQALTDVIVITARRGIVGEPATPAEQKFVKQCAAEIRVRLDRAREALYRFEEILDA